MTGTSWFDVHDLVAGLPRAMVVQGDESPVCVVRRAEFARLRWDESDRQILQTGSNDLALAESLAAEPERFPLVQVYGSRVMILAYLDRVSRREVAELLLESYRLRAGRRGKRVDEAAYFALAGTSTRHRNLRLRRPAE